MSFRGINTTVIQIRRQVFTEVARMAYANVKGEQANHLMRKIPYTIIPGELLAVSSSTMEASVLTSTGVSPQA